MKNVKVLVLAVLLGTGISKAAPVTVSVAQKAGQNFYAQKSAATAALSLAYTETDANNLPVYYAFNINTNKGFVIVSAEDAAYPIIGYSDEGSFVAPVANNNVYYWLQLRKSEVAAIRTQNIAATADIANAWATYVTPNANHILTHNAAVSRDSVLPLCRTYWDQAPYYNALCPGGSVTGCVATAMAQIMKYWSYPSTGISSSCYDETTNRGYSENYGQLCASYDTSHYDWAAMPIELGKNNAQVAELMYDCGVSVDMDYSPSESGAQVIGGGASAYNSYTAYFGYDANLINSAFYQNYSQANWIALLESELNNKRPMQFEGTDPKQGGHSWVCDGYSATNEMHMNWGWSGQDDGYYAVTLLNPNGFDFSEYIGVIYGIQPPAQALGVQKISTATTITVYPNPSHGVFNFSLPDNNTYQVKVYNVIGQEVNTAVVSSANNAINLSAQPKGVYIYKLLTEKGEVASTGRIVVE